MFPIVNTCILNQSNDYLLLNYALNVAISMSLKLKEEMNHFLLLDVLVNDDDFGLNIELGTFAKSLQKKSSGH
jgi:hypothetical protein